MTLADVLLWVGVVTGLLLSVSLLSIVGYRRVAAVRHRFRWRLSRILPYAGFLGLILAINSAVRDIGQELSWVIGLRITGTIYAIEGEFVHWVQSFATSELTLFFSAVYIYGYVYLLVFPLLAYGLLDDLTRFRKLTLAYALNYGIGLLCYIVFVAYGPRNLMSELVEGLLYVNWPQSQLLTSEVNTNTNVFPSLHSSLSVTVAILAVRSRDIYRRWVPIAVPLALCVCISTMYLGIHWGTDVVAGIALAVLSVRGADHLHERIRDRFPSAPVALARFRAWARQKRA